MPRNDGLVRSDVSEAVRRVMVIVDLALQMRREDRVNSAAVSMDNIPMAMVCVGVKMEQWNHRDPCHHPDTKHAA